MGGGGVTRLIKLVLVSTHLTPNAASTVLYCMVNSLDFIAE